MKRKTSEKKQARLGVAVAPHGRAGRPGGRHRGRARVVRDGLPRGWQALPAPHRGSSAWEPRSPAQAPAGSTAGELVRGSLVLGAPRPHYCRSRNVSLGLKEIAKWHSSSGGGYGEVLRSRLGQGGATAPRCVLHSSVCTYTYAPTRARTRAVRRTRLIRPGGGDCGCGPGIR